MVHAPWGHNTICQLAIIGTTLGQRVVTTHHFEASLAAEGAFGGLDAARLAAQSLLVDAWVTSMEGAYLGMMPSTYKINMVRGQVLEVGGQYNHRLTPTERTNFTLTDGTAGATPVDDTAAAGVIRWRSNLAGKQYRGRSYIGPLQGAWNELGYLTASGISALGNYGTAMQAWYVSTVAPVHPWNLTIYSKPYDQGEYGYVKGSGAARIFYFPPDYAGNSTNVISHSVDNVMRTQRRRQLGVGV
jgi:hypothetical protein